MWAVRPVIALVALLLRGGGWFRGTPHPRPTLTRADQLLVISPGDVDSPVALAQLTAACAKLAESGVKRLLLREPHISHSQLERLVQSLMPLYPSEGLLVHEKCAGAQAVAAAHNLGLHLASTTDWKARRASFRGRLGVSAHSLEEVQLAASCGCQWAFLSPVAQPTSKPDDARPSIGEAAVLRAQRITPDLDIVALGGITPAAAARLAAGGGRGVAVLGGIFGRGCATAPGEAQDCAAAYLKSVAEVMTHV